MGIQGLVRFIKTNAPSACGSYDITRFNGLTVAVDASLLIHQIVIALRSTGKDMTNKQGQLTSHLGGLFYKIIGFIKNGIVPIFVFDGKAPEIKGSTIEKRKQKREQAEENLAKEDLDEDEYIKNFKLTYRIQKEDINEAMILLDLMGIPYIVAPGEADVVCSWLTIRTDAEGKKYAKGVCSDDSDMLVLGANYLFKDMSKSINKKTPITVINLKKALVQLDLTMDQFIDFSVMLGCDYCDNIKGIGPKTAYKMISKHKSLEAVLDFLHRKDGKDSIDSSDEENNNKSDGAKNEACMLSAKKYFKSAVKKLDDSENFILTDDNLYLRKIQFDALIDFLCVKHNFDFLRIHGAVVKLNDLYKKMKITRENTKEVHKILQPRSESYEFSTLSDEIEFLPSEEEDQKLQSKDTPETKEISKKSKKAEIKFYPSENESQTEDQKLQSKYTPEKKEILKKSKRTEPHKKKFIDSTISKIRKKNTT